MRENERITFFGRARIVNRGSIARNSEQCTRIDRKSRIRREDSHLFSRCYTVRVGILVATRTKFLTGRESPKANGIYV